MSLLLRWFATGFKGGKILLYLLVVMGFIWQIKMRDYAEDRFLNARQELSAAQLQLKQLEAELNSTQAQQQHLLALINENQRQKQTAEKNSQRQQQKLPLTLTGNSCAAERVPDATLQLQRQITGAASVDATS